MLNMTRPSYFQLLLGYGWCVAPQNHVPMSPQILQMLPMSTNIGKKSVIYVISIKHDQGPDLLKVCLCKNVYKLDITQEKADLRTGCTEYCIFHMCKITPLVHSVHLPKLICIMKCFYSQNTRRRKRKYVWWVISVTVTASIYIIRSKVKCPALHTEGFCYCGQEEI